MVFVHGFLLGDVVLENLLWSFGVVATFGALAVSLRLLWRGLYFHFFLFFYFLVIASLISRLAPDIMFLQILSVTGIILVLIYSFYQRK
jgi:hypothetical protein